MARGVNWKSIAAAATPESLERLETLLWDAGAVSVTAQDAGDEPLFEPGPDEQPLWKRMVVTGLFDEGVDLARVSSTLAGDNFDILGVDEVVDRQWEREWLHGFKPMRFGTRLVVCPGEYQAPPGEGIVMRVDPGLAFGTGTHPTTRLCLEWIDANIIAGMNVLDYGCGSGILGIACLLLSASRVVAVDNDRQALAATSANAHKNGVESRLAACGPDAVPTGPYDVVIANILAGPLIGLAARLTGFVGAGSHLVLSGIMENQVDWVAGAYPEIRFDKPRTLDGWVCLHGGRL